MRVRGLHWLRMCDAQAPQDWDSFPDESVMAAVAFGRIDKVLHRRGQSTVGVELALAMVRRAAADAAGDDALRRHQLEQWAVRELTRAVYAGVGLGSAKVFVENCLAAEGDADAMAKRR